MGGSYRLIRIAGIDIKVHLTFLLIVLLGSVQWGSRYGGAGVGFGALLMVLLFGCITLHELAHCLAARRLGIPVEEILLLPVGGMALLGREPTKPWQELLIAAAGPLVNIVMAALLWLSVGSSLGTFTLTGMLEARDHGLSLTTVQLWLLEANLTLIIFNLLPAYPLDGGRILRALLAFPLGWEEATRLAVKAGKMLAIVLAALAVLTANLLLGLIALLLYMSASAPRRQAADPGLVEGLTARQLAAESGITFRVGDRMLAAVKALLLSPQRVFVVLHGERPIGLLSRQTILEALRERGRAALETYITVPMEREPLLIPADTPYPAIVALLRQRRAAVGLVVDGQQLCGLITWDQLAELERLAGTIDAPAMRQVLAVREVVRV